MASAERSARPERRRRRWSVRIRILTAVLLTTALGMTGAGVASYLIARTDTYNGIRQDLIQEYGEIQTVAKMAGDGNSGRPIKGPEDVLYLGIKSSIPDPNEAIMGLVGGRVALVPTIDPEDFAFQKSIEQDTELVRAAAAVQPGDEITVRELSTDRHPSLAFISVPIQVSGSPDLGHYVAVVDVQATFVPVQRTHLTYAGLGLLALVVVALVGYQVAGRLLAPLRSLRSTAQRISDADLTDRIPENQLSSRDEVADLGRTMNAMLDRLTHSFDNQRRLLDDAGHELRTPITIVRGHLELLDPNDPEEINETRDLAMDELDRMQRLVDDLMVLAKAKRPDFVRTAPVVVSDLLASVLDKVTPLAERDWRIEASTDATVSLDVQRVTQALVQLVANAIRYTSVGAVIALGARVYGLELRIWVRDEGQGINHVDQERIFERFGRAQQHESEIDVEGAGLGLAIVTAISEAHRGRVALTSEPGSGSTFTLCLPIEPPSRRDLDDQQPAGPSDPSEPSRDQRSRTWPTS